MMAESKSHGGSYGGKRPGAGRPVAGDEATEARTVTLLPRHWAWLNGGNVSLGLRETLDRLTLSVASEAQYLQSLFEANELAAILDATNGWLMETSSLAHIAIEVEDALPGGLAAKWSIDGPALMDKMSRLGYFQCWVLADACRLWWERVGAGETLQPGQLFD